MKKCISRVEESGDTIKIVDSDAHNGLDNQLAKFAEDFGLVWNGDNVRVFTVATPNDFTRFEMFGVNVIYYETEVRERSLNDAEKEWCEDTIMYGGSNMPDELYEVTIPHPDSLRKAILKGDLSAFEKLETTVEEWDSRQRIVESLQTEIEESEYQLNQLRHYGNPHDLPPRLNPNKTDEDKDTLRKIVLAQNAGYVDSWKEVFGIRYSKLKEARYRMLSSLHEPKLRDPHTKLVDLELIGKEEKSYCRTCAAVWDEEDLLHIKRKGYDDSTLRVCENCAKMREGDLFTVNAVASAFDRRAKRLDNGQRRLHSDFAD